MRLPEKTAIKTEYVGLKVDEDEKKELKELAAKHNMTISTLIRYAINQLQKTDKNDDQ